MRDTQKKGRTILSRDWLKALGVFIVVQLIFIVLDNLSWQMTFREFHEGGLFDRLSETKLFSAFTLYNTPHYNFFTVLFAILLLLYALISIIIGIFSNKRTSS